MIKTIIFFSGSESKCCRFLEFVILCLAPKKLNSRKSYAWKRKTHSLLRITAAILGGVVLPNMEENCQAFEIETWLNYEIPQNNGPLVTFPAGNAGPAPLRVVANSSSISASMSLNGRRACKRWKKKGNIEHYTVVRDSPSPWVPWGYLQGSGRTLSH